MHGAASGTGDSADQVECSIHPASKTVSLGRAEHVTSPEIGRRLRVATVVRWIRYAAIPAFVSRAFRHAGFFAERGCRDHVASRIRRPPMSMRNIGVDCGPVDARASWLTNTASIAARSTGSPGRSTGHQAQELELALPPGMGLIQPIKDGDTLQDMLLRGEIDGLLAPKPPQHLDGNPALIRLFPDFETQNRPYYQRTGLFPIMHLIGLRKTVAAETSVVGPRALRWLCRGPRSSAEASARRLARKRQPPVAALAGRIPGADVGDAWPGLLDYGFNRNRAKMKPSAAIPQTASPPIA